MAQREVLDIKLSLDKTTGSLITSPPEKYRSRRMKNIKSALQIKPTAVSRNLESELLSCDNELREFHLQKKTKCSLLTVVESSSGKKDRKIVETFYCHFTNTTLLKKFQKVINMVRIICKMLNLWKRYDENCDTREEVHSTRGRLVTTHQGNRITLTTRCRIKRHQNTYRNLNRENFRI